MKHTVVDVLMCNLPTEQALLTESNLDQNDATDSGIHDAHVCWLGSDVNSDTKGYKFMYAFQGPQKMLTAPMNMKAYTLGKGRGQSKLLRKKKREHMSNSNFNIIN